VTVLYCQYRGCNWYFWDGAVAVRASTARVPLKLIATLHEPTVDFGTTLEEIARKHWLYVRKVRRYAADYGSVYLSLDGVPWEIHDIDDEIAYESAFSAFKAEQRFYL